MTACTHTLGDPDGLACTRDDQHEPGHGCTYEAAWAKDAERDEE